METQVNDIVSEQVAELVEEPVVDCASNGTEEVVVEEPQVSLNGEQSSEAEAEVKDEGEKEEKTPQVEGGLINATEDNEL